MAEFGVVMHDWSRMCKHFWTGDPTVECSEDCPLKEIWCPCMDEPVMDAGKFDAEKLESVVTEWAAEHPEPVYPTRREWLIKLGIISFEPDLHLLLYPAPTTLTNAVKAYLNEEGSKPIPAGIAEKLGIEPKEGV